MLKDLLERALAAETPDMLWGSDSELNDDAWDLALTARGMLDAARLLDVRYHLLVTNVPYLTRGNLTRFATNFVIYQRFLPSSSYA